MKRTTLSPLILAITLLLGVAGCTSDTPTGPELETDDQESATLSELLSGANKVTADGELLIDAPHGEDINVRKLLTGSTESAGADTTCEETGYSWRQPVARTAPLGHGCDEIPYDHVDVDETHLIYVNDSSNRILYRATDDSAPDMQARLIGDTFSIIDCSACNAVTTTHLVSSFKIKTGIISLVLGPPQSPSYLALTVGGTGYTLDFDPLLDLGGEVPDTFFILTTVVGTINGDTIKVYDWVQ